MQPLGGAKSNKNSSLTQKPQFLPVKLYFNKINGICCNIREVVHDDLQSGRNNKIEFIVIASKRSLDQLLEEEYWVSPSILTQSQTFLANGSRLKWILNSKNYTFVSIWTNSLFKLLLYQIYIFVINSWIIKLNKNYYQN